MVGVVGDDSEISICVTVDSPSSSPLSSTFVEAVAAIDPVLVVVVVVSSGTSSVLFDPVAVSSEVGVPPLTIL